jgi:glycosyltransferase involved in cell wall biosynthesis
MSTLNGCIMKLSFVIPAHNEEKYIGKCLDSVFKAIGNDPEFEVIVADNNSSDNTREVVARYPRAILVHEPKPGANSARQAGFLRARGNLIANVDADTILTPNWIQNATKEFSKNEKLVCLSGPFIYYDLPRKIYALVKIFYALTFFMYLINRFVLRNTSVIQGGNYVVKRSALEKIGGHNTHITFYGDDTDLANRLSKVGKVKFTFRFPIYSSGRRLATEGAFTMGFRYGINYFWTAYFGKPLHQTSIVVRPKQKNGTLTYRPVNKAREWLIASSLIVALLAFLAGVGLLGYVLVQSGIISAITLTNMKAEAQKINMKIQNFSNSVQR